MNVLYAGYANPISISVPGVPANAISASMSGGSFVSKGNGHFVATPSTVGKDVTIHVTARDKGQVRSLPPFCFPCQKIARSYRLYRNGNRQIQRWRFGKGQSDGCHGHSCSHRRWTSGYSFQGSRFRNSLLRQYG